MEKLSPIRVALALTYVAAMLTLYLDVFVWRTV
jgi:hypothetical protein